MASYAEIRKQARKQHNKAYANGGRTRKPGVVVNVITSSPGGAQGPGPAGPPMMPGGMNGPVMPPPPPPMPGPGGLPPQIKNQAMGAMGGPPGMFANGGRAGCNEGRLSHGGVDRNANGGRAGYSKGGGVMAGAGSGVGRLAHNKNPKRK